jgi:hypothetical protein
LSNNGHIDFFNYYDKQAAIIELVFGEYDGWGLCIELASSGDQKPMLLALAYSHHSSENGIDILHISALDSISPSDAELKYPGPIIEYGYPRGEAMQVTLASGINAIIRENDAEAAQVLVEREFLLLQYYVDTQYWREAWIRYYRLIYRDSYDRIKNPAIAIVRNLGGLDAVNDDAKRAFAQKALGYVQEFSYERDFTGSDFVNLVSAVIEKRGDCDSRSMLWAIMLSLADIRSAMMVSPYFSHAMGLADIAGDGARFEHLGTQWLVAETTAKIDIGLIDQEQSDPNYWLGIVFE